MQSSFQDSSLFGNCTSLSGRASQLLPGVLRISSWWARLMRPYSSGQSGGSWEARASELVASGPGQPRLVTLISDRDRFPFCCDKGLRSTAKVNNNLHIAKSSRLLFFVSLQCTLYPWLSQCSPLLGTSCFSSCFFVSPLVYFLLYPITVGCSSSGLSPRPSPLTPHSSQAFSSNS